MIFSKFLMHRWKNIRLRQKRVQLSPVSRMSKAEIMVIMIAMALSLLTHCSYPCKQRFWLEASTLSNRGEMRQHLPTD